MKESNTAIFRYKEPILYVTPKSGVYLDKDDMKQMLEEKEMFIKYMLATIIVIILLVLVNKALYN